MLGYFVDMDVKFNSSLFHYILLRDVKDIKRDFMPFDLNHTIVTFSKDDFFLVTGF